MTPLLALALLQGPPADYAKDPAYAKPITVEMAMAPLDRLVDAMAKASGLPLAYSGTLRDLKATVLVKDLPAARAMEALGDALGLVWRPDGAQLRLVRPDGQSAQEAAYRKEEIASAQQGATTEIAEAAVPEAYTPGGVPIRRRRGPRPGTGKAAPRFDPDLLGLEVPDGTPPSRLVPPGTTGKSAFAKAVGAWSGVQADLPEAWSRAIAPAYPKSAWLGGRLTLADLLVAWHAASGLPVVADAFRVPAKGTGVPPASALAALQAVAAGEGASLRVAGGVARVRHPAFWRLREQEISESDWNAIERGSAGLDGLVAFAGRLKPAQAASFLSLEPPVSKVDTRAFREAYPALLLWSALPGAARSALLAGRPVGLAQVSGAADAYAFALREAPYYGMGDPSAVLAMDPAKVGIFGSPGANSISIRLAGERGEGVGYTLPFSAVPLSPPGERGRG